MHTCTENSYNLFKNIIYNNGKLFSSSIKEITFVPVAYRTKIILEPLKENIRPLKTYKSCVLHKRHVEGGYVHILMDECWGMFYGIKKYNIEPEFILSLDNPEKPFNGNWNNWLQLFLKYETKEESEIKSPILIKNVIVGWAKNTVIFKDQSFNYQSFPESIRSIHETQDNFDPTKIIFDVRSSLRTILNIEQVKKELSHLNIEFVNFAKISVPDQISKMYNAAIFVSQHGAGLANAIFMRKGSKVIEIIQEDYKNYDAYEMISKQFKLNYIKHIEPKKNCITTKSKHKKRDQDLIINIDKLKNKINQHY